VAAAQAFCAPLGLREPRDRDLELMLMKAGALVIPGRSRGDGHLLRGPRRSLIVVREELYGTPEGTFVIGHEAGHLLLHHALDDLPICTGERAGATRGTLATRRAEGEASDVGSEILMPEAWFAPLVRGTAEAPSLADLVAIAAYFRVSLEAAALRALLFVTRPCAVVVAVEGRVAWWAASEGFSVYVHRKAPLPDGTAAARVARGGAAAAGERIRGACWGEETRGAVELTEHALAAPGPCGEAKVVAWLVQVV
jgi:Zn-dependent peptidase ImmA (M78 family)